MLAGISKRVWEGRWGYFFIAPAMIPFVVFTAVPLLQGLWLSFYKAGVNRDKWQYIGLKNYTNLLTRDPVFPTAIKNTFLFVLGVVPAAMIICLFVAVLIYPLSQRKQTFFRAAFYMPVVSAGVVLAMVWVYIYSQEYGLLNYIFESLGLLDLLNSGGENRLAGTNRYRPALIGDSGIELEPRAAAHSLPGRAGRDTGDALRRRENRRR